MYQLVTTIVDCKCAVNEMTTNQIYAWLYMYTSYEWKSIETEHSYHVSDAIAEYMANESVWLAEYYSRYIK